ncbi:ABC transporter permease [Embleya sp. NPDC127516]|uniref:ABC transporter permease n=1 Tax=Embleya sp. NPDC127516 TaxID=3363990 RepID=UPI0038299FA9
MTDVLAAEWLKLRTVRSTYIVLAALAVAMAGTCALAAYGAHTWDGLSATDRAHFSMSPLEPLFLTVAEMSMAVLGALTITSEYAGGMIRDTLVAVPRRGRVVWAKAAVVGTFALALGSVCVFATSYLTRAVVGDRPIPAYTDAGAPTTGLLITQSLAITVAALVGYGLGAVLRSTAGTISAVAGLLYVVPMVAHNLPAPWDARAGSFALDSLPGQLAGTGNPYSIYGTTLPPIAAAAVMGAYAVVPPTVAAIRIRRRDL